MKKLCSISVAMAWLLRIGPQQGGSFEGKLIRAKQELTVDDECMQGEAVDLLESLVYESARCSRLCSFSFEKVPYCWWLVSALGAGNLLSLSILRMRWSEDFPQGQCTVYCS